VDRRPIPPNRTVEAEDEAFVETIPKPREDPEGKDGGVDVRFDDELAGPGACEGTSM
jgi:hypothetical protein